jgi:hypothetical protein
MTVRPFSSTIALSCDATRNRVTVARWVSEVFDARPTYIARARDVGWDGSNRAPHPRRPARRCRGRFGLNLAVGR